MSAHKCEGLVRQTGFFYSFKCGKAAAYEHEGQWFCKTHHPPNIRAKAEIKVAKWEENWRARRAEADVADIAKVEVYRRADCYPDMLAALEAILPWAPKSTATEGGAASRSEAVKAADKVRAAIAKATGAPQ